MYLVRGIKQTAVLWNKNYSTYRGRHDIFELRGLLPCIARSLPPRITQANRAPTTQPSALYQITQKVHDEIYCFQIFNYN